MLKADYFLYTFLVSSFSYEAVDTVSAYGSSDKKETGAQRLDKDFTSIILELKRSNFNLYSPTLIDSLTIYPMSGITRSGTLIIYNPDSLKLAGNILKKHENLTAYVQSKKTVTPAEEKMLYKKLLESANAKAENIATLAGRKIKQVESVTEKENENEEGYTSYPPLSALEGSVIPGWHTSIGAPAFASTSKVIYYPIAGALTVRYSLQPALNK